MWIHPQLSNRWSPPVRQSRISYRSAARALAACVDALDACNLRSDAARLLASIRARHPRRSILAEVDAIAAARGERA
ncbi:MAG: hypothetical protein AB7Q97_12575 [Gammaproteobacteria bacterium]